MEVGMVLWLILGILALLIMGFLIIRISIELEYSDKKLGVMLRLGFIKIRLHPSPDRKGKEKTADKKKPKATLGQFREVISLLSYISEKVKKRFVIDYFTLHYRAAAEDAAKAALSFGYASFIAGAGLPILENSLTVRKKDIRTSVSFTEKESFLYFKTRLSLPLRLLPYIAIIFGYRYNNFKSQ
jgi:hypothetical protein